MKVKHLIAELQKCDPELPVETEGCDCIGDTCLVRAVDGVVYITRSQDAGLFGTEGSHGDFDDYENDQDTPKPLEE